MKRKARQRRMQLREQGLQATGVGLSKQSALTVRIAPAWSPEQALAVYEVLDDLMDSIWRQYGLEIVQACKNERTTNAQHFRAAYVDADDVPF